MVAVISTNRSLAKSFYYNEHKVQSGQATCILAANYPCEPDELSVKQRLAILHRRVELNENLSKNCVHISLNFHPSDQLSKHSLQDISRLYMDRIGFGQQPFLVYQHLDAGHPHLHLVTVNLRADGSWINTFRMGIKLSQKVTRQIEKTFHLKAAIRAPKQHLPALSAQTLHYGKTPTAPTIASVLARVLPHFHYSTLTELNAVLRHYNVCADPASRNHKSALYQGLVYRALSEDGRKIGTPIKASSFPLRPTLAYLNARFMSGESHRPPHQHRVRSIIDLSLRGAIQSFAELQTELAQERIKIVFAVAANGKLSELFFVDFQTRCVFSASGLGENYTPNKLLERLQGASQALNAQNTLYQREPFMAAAVSFQAGGRHSAQTPGSSGAKPDSEQDQLILQLFAPVPDGDYLPWQLKRRPKKKRKEISIQL